ncbi:hypothetical protein KVV02_001623 [Mortierella alpina]|uniref:Uncharacterized protein n=1 Tax=Mortierella alpina TaxID=64518 RepID=A0A9P8AC04_MORAP|nr:hypothetical protein KVV02_001623 [Mortierella alpina]
MALREISTSAQMDLDDSALHSASGMPLCTILEFPGEEYEDEHDPASSSRDRVPEDNFNTTSIEQSCPAPSPTDARSGRSQRLSINLSLLSPSLPASLSSANSSSPPSATYSSCSSAVSSPGSGLSPVLNPFQWTSDMRQYIMTDIGPQPSNSQVPALRSPTRLVRQRSYSKIGGPGFMAPSPTSSMGKGMGMSLSPTSPSSYFTACARLATSVTTANTTGSLQTQAMGGPYGHSSLGFYNRPRHGSLTDIYTS